MFLDAGFIDFGRPTHSVTLDQFWVQVHGGILSAVRTCFFAVSLAGPTYPENLIAFKILAVAPMALARVLRV